MLPYFIGKWHEVKMSRADKFWSKINKTKTCWFWTGYTDSGGYGQFGSGKMRVKVHRFSYELFNGPIPKGQGYHGICVLHTCDNRTCVNPAHLFLGTHQDNMDDKVIKNRQYKKINDHIMNEIRMLYKTDNYSYRDLAKKFEISYSLVGLIVKGYKHVTL
jgi:hypothetical protein